MQEGKFIENIKKYASNKYISFHTPAHRGRNKYINKILKSKYDLTELSETDNLFNPQGCIKELENILKNTFGGADFFLLPNGATSGMEAVVSIFNENDKILVDRNCHISVINGFILSGAKPVFIDTKLNELNIPLPPTIENIRDAFEKNCDVKALIVTTPNYYGLKADLKKISAFCKEKNIISIADEAHGSHFYFSDKSNTAIDMGFDISVLSFHKNLPGLTQTGGMAVNNKLLSLKLKEKIRVFTSTSPSYLLMLSVDAMLKDMKNDGRRKLNKIIKYSKNLRSRLKKNGIRVLLSDDPTRLVVNSLNADVKAEQIKEKYKIVCEMSDSSNITFIISLHSKKKELKLLEKAIIEFLKEPDLTKNSFALPKQILSPKNAVLKPYEYVQIYECEGRISAEYILDFPPSVPILIPGEMIDYEITKKIKDKKEIKCIRK